MRTTQAQITDDAPTGDHRADLARAKLLDGRIASLRRLGAEDVGVVLALHQTLPDRDRYFRFVTLCPVDLQQLTSALTSPDDDHLRGVATVLLRHLGHLSRRHGLQRLVADVLSANHLVFKVLSDAGWPARRRTDGTITHLEIDLAAAA